jgi:hypothetical protein
MRLWQVRRLLEQIIRISQESNCRLVATQHHHTRPNHPELVAW